MGVEGEVDLAVSLVGEVLFQVGEGVMCIVLLAGVELIRQTNG